MCPQWLFPVLCPKGHSTADRGVQLLVALIALRGHSPPQHRGFSCPQVPVTTRGTLPFSSREYDHPGHTGGHGHPGHPPPQLAGHHCHGMLGRAAASPHPSPDCCPPVQAQPRHTCPRCATAVRWWIPRRHPCEGRGARPWCCHTAPPLLPQGEQCPQHGPLRGQAQPGGSVPAPARATSHTSGHGTCHPSLALSHVTCTLSPTPCTEPW